MSKKISKLLLALLLVIVTLSSFSVSFAEVDGDKTKAVTTSETQGESVATGETEESDATAEQEIHNGDLYIFDTDIVMDKLVDGNVFLFGTNVEITGQVNGSLFVFADTIKFEEAYIRYSIFACANSVYYNAVCNDLYVATTDLETTYASIVYRDLKSLSSNAILKAAVGRDVDLICDTLNLGESEDIPIIYGSLRYTANKEMEIPEGVISGNGTVTYTKPSDTASSVIDILVGFCTSIVTVLIIYAIAKKCTPNFSEKLASQKLTPAKLLKAFGLGLGSIILVTIAFILLLTTAIGINLAFILGLLFIVLCLLAVPVATIIITNLLKPALKIEKTSMFYLILALVSIILYGITVIPVVGGILGFIITMIAIGLLIDMYLPHKELTDEEKAVIEEAKKQAKEMKEARKQEKLEAKEVKKQAKESKKENKE